MGSQDSWATSPKEYTQILSLLALKINDWSAYFHIKKCDGLVMFAVTEPRLKLLDVSHPYLYMPASFLMPMPESSFSVYAVFESFDIWVRKKSKKKKEIWNYSNWFLIIKVWAAYIVSVIITILALYVFNRYVAYNYKLAIDTDAKGSKTDAVHGHRMKGVFPYVIGLMLHQGLKFS